MLILFGAYKGTVRAGRLLLGQPVLCERPGGRPVARRLPPAETPARHAGAGPTSCRATRSSLRARTLNGDKLKVNDKRGNPIEIAAVVVWRVDDTAQAIFDVDDFESYVAMQSESALRHLASAYAYDHGEGRHRDHAARQRRRGLAGAARGAAERLAKAGVTRRRGAPHPPGLRARDRPGDAAPPAGRGRDRRAQEDRARAPSAWWSMALNELTEKHVVDFDDERKAAMVSNLMVVLCGESQVTPVVNTGTLYQ